MFLNRGFFVKGRPQIVRPAVTLSDSVHNAAHRLLLLRTIAHANYLRCSSDIQNDFHN